MTGTSTHVLRYLDRPLTLAGKPNSRSKDQVATRIQDFNDGIRVRHWVDQNRVKVYNEQNVLRRETTINNPKKFQVHRHKQGQSSDEPKKRLPLRKGVMDAALRAKVSQEVNDRFIREKQLSAKVSRHLRLLRVHGIIRKVPKQNRYQLTLKRDQTDQSFECIFSCIH